MDEQLVSNEHSAMPNLITFHLTSIWSLFLLVHAVVYIGQKLRE